MSDSTKSTPALVEKFVIRLPKGLREQIKTLSEHNRRSMNSEIIMVLEKHIRQSLQQEDLQDFSSDEILREMQNMQYAENNDMNSSGDQQTNDVLRRRLEALPPEKKEALLELLG
ncbi:MAG: hypothetical protein CMP91_05750 [Gammaproteobacteria bacterium]|nr:hypothetical protein [Gammaproteobacteria bacterium]MAY02498.1 hypothetical protein [Gammaproteobacteria bacterium]